eukprot:CCRYP_012753-RB/>CCRYP_012753-RB protein AED:0.37 eAED:0.73 QI:0/0/0/1/0/0/2/0/54
MFQQIRLVVWVVGCKNNAQSIRIMLYIPPEEMCKKMLVLYGSRGMALGVRNLPN